MCCSLMMTHGNTTGLFFIVAFSFAHDIRGCDDMATGLFFVGRHFCRHALLQGMLALGDQSETDSQCLGDSL